MVRDIYPKIGDDKESIEGTTRLPANQPKFNRHAKYWSCLASLYSLSFKPTLPLSTFQIIGSLNPWHACMFAD
jgi:hypothetical protein